jgi:YD repeat-containing protein
MGTWCARDALSHTATFRYDAIGRLTAMVSPNGHVAGANPISYTTTLTADAFGATTAITDPLGHQTAYQYDANRNLVAVTDARDQTTR